MWSFVKIPPLPDEPNRHVVLLEKYHVEENQGVTPGTIIAIVRGDSTCYAIRTTRWAKVRKTFFDSGYRVGIGDPIALLTLYEDPGDDTSEVEYITIESRDPNSSIPIFRKYLSFIHNAKMKWNEFRRRPKNNR